LYSQSRKQGRGIVHLGGQTAGMEQHRPDVAPQVLDLYERGIDACQGLA
jgi:hypothetical protein